MESTFDFIYKEEMWYISAFINTNYINKKIISREMKDFVVNKLKNLKIENLRPYLPDDVKRAVMGMIENVRIEIEWVSYIDHFPFKDENVNVGFNTLGYFKFEVDYYVGNPWECAEIKPVMIQQIPIFVKDFLVEFSDGEDKKYLKIDTESPIFLFVTSEKTTSGKIEWNESNIEKYKWVLGNWTEIYSGQWPDYNESLYTSRVQDNLSNRLTELHYIKRNSGFIYMEESNYSMFFDSYMRQFVLEPTPRIRAMLFALISINSSLDLLFLKRYSEGFISLDDIEEKISNLKYLRGLIQTKLSMIYDELDYNRRQHYTSILTHLIKHFEFNRLIRRINEKFSTLSESLQELYLKHSEEAQQKTEQLSETLNVLFGIAVLADFAAVVVAAFSFIDGFTEGNAIFSIVNGVVAGVIAAVFIWTMRAFIKNKLEKKKEVVTKETVDCIIMDDKENIVIIQREYPPFKGYNALPGAFIRPGETHMATIDRIGKEKTNLKIKFEKKLGVYRERGRDPRGEITSHAYQCTIVDGLDTITAKLIPLKDAKKLKMGFDHSKILNELIP